VFPVSTDGIFQNKYFREQRAYKKVAIGTAAAKYYGDLGSRAPSMQTIEESMDNELLKLIPLVNGGLVPTEAEKRFYAIGFKKWLNGQRLELEKEKEKSSEVVTDSEEN
jgi:hypothetical protein